MPERLFPLRLRSGVFGRFVEVASFVGIDGFAILRKVKIDPRWLQDPEGWLPAGSIARALESAAKESGRDDFGILLGDCQTAPNLGPVALLLEHELSARDIVSAAIEFHPTITDAVVMTFVEEAGTAIGGYDVRTQPPSPRLSDFVVAVASNVLIDATVGRWRPASIHFRHERPHCEETFARFFECPISFDDEFDGWTSSTSELSAVTRAGNRTLVSYARHLLRLTPEMNARDTFTARVATTVYLLVRYGTPSLDRTAANLGISRRQVQRRLAREGQSFEKVLNGVRRRVATQSLVQSAKPISQVAYSAGFSDPGAFSRWFSHEFHSSPKRWREAHRPKTVVPAG